MSQRDFCSSLFEYSRFVTREVKIGDVPVGAANPIRIQSMTTTDTMDTAATVKQTIDLIEAGCDYVRITAPSLKEAQNLAEIKKQVRAAGFNTPIIADIHFTPNAAELAAKIIEKVRVNPGNYADKKKFENFDFTDASYNAEIERIRERFTPLVKVCKEYGTAMRIGTNHGSLSDRILSRYGDTPLGMVESAMEFLRICEDEGYYNIVLSMKASNPKVMIEAYRLLVNKMIANKMNYPLHLGVTEAGDGEDGRIKSAAGIGTLLEDGLGDTIRVSLTEDSVYEVPVARQIVGRYSTRTGKKSNLVLPPDVVEKNYNPFEFEKRNSFEVLNIGGSNVPRAIADLSKKEKITQASLFAFGYNYSVPLDKWNLSDTAFDFAYAGSNDITFEIPGTLGLIFNSDKWSEYQTKERCFPLFCGKEIFSASAISPVLNFVAVDSDTITDEYISKINTYKNIVLVADTFNEHGFAEQRAIFIKLKQQGCKHPVIVKRNYKEISTEQFQLYSATDFGGLLIDGFGDGTWIRADKNIPDQLISNTTFGILQATRTRISKTEYISCPSCGRTLFDLQETTQKIRKRTEHLKGVKIGIMGCIVNGPGEMADADYGYVGTGIGKITLYKGREVVKKNINSEFAVDELVELIKSHGDWVEVEEVV